MMNVPAGRPSARRELLWERSGPGLHALVTVAAAGALLVACTSVWADLPSQIPEGKLLLQEHLQDALEVGIYGPATATAGEPALLAVLVMGNEMTRISSGIVLMSAPHGGVTFRSSPLPSVHYIPCRQWSPDTVSEWKQLLIIGPEMLWAYRILPLAHIAFKGGPGELLDLILAVRDRPSPPAGSPALNAVEYDHIGTAFITDETITDATAVATRVSAGDECQGAHGIRAQFPVVINDPTLPMYVWLLLNANGQHITRNLSVQLPTRSQQFAESSEAIGPPELSSPSPDARVADLVEVSGQTKPGLLVAAWVEIYDPQDPELRTKLPPVRHIADDFGLFNIPVSLPLADAGPGAALAYELHVRTEAPAYRSPEAIRKLNLSAAE